MWNFAKKRGDSKVELNIPGRYKKIDGYDEYYITDTGDVYSYRTRPVGYQGLRRMSLRGINDPKRYLQVCLSKDGVIRYLQVHRLVAKYFCNGYFDGAVVNHIDGNIHNNYYTNLEWVSQRENIHKSYVSSGIDQTRNYRYYSLEDTTGHILGIFKGRNEAVKYVLSNNLDTSPSSLVRHGISRGYQLLETPHQKL